MNPIYSHPRFTHAFRDELKLARDANPEIRAARNPAIQWIAANNADKLLYQGLSQSTKPKPIAGASILLFPALAGQGRHVGIVMGLDPKDNLRGLTSNEITQPEKETTAAKSQAPKNIDAFNALKSSGAQRDLIQHAVNAACADQLELVEKVCAECQMFGTTAAFVLVLTADKPLVFVTPLVVYGPSQNHPTQPFTGRVTLP